MNFYKNDQIPPHLKQYFQDAPDRSVWGGDRDCDHDWGDTIPGSNKGGSGTPTDKNNRGEGYGRGEPRGQYCTKCEAWLGQLGLEPTPYAFIEHLVEIFSEVKRVLRDDGTLWLNLGDSYANPCIQSSALSSTGGFTGERVRAGKKGTMQSVLRAIPDGIKYKDLVGIPWMTAFALRANGWYLRADIIWCLSGGTVVYARTQKGDMPMTIKDMARLDPKTVKLWNGVKWTQVLGWSKSGRKGDELEIVLRSGERISCTPTHQFPTKRGLIKASEIVAGDHMTQTLLPEPDPIKQPEHVGLDAAWFAGLFLAEGSKFGIDDEKIQISGHVKETDRLARVQRIAKSYGGYSTFTIDGNKQTIRVYGKLLASLIKELVSGKDAHDKCMAPVCWRYGNDFLRSMLDGYLSGDGHWDEANKRWRLGFCRNYNLERDLRVLSARLGFKLTLNPTFAEGFGKKWPSFRGEIRFDVSDYHTSKDMCEVIEIRKARCRNVYDIGVEDDPHLFALASGILTHNSKANPMPESVTDRPTKAHEYLFLLTKNEQYFYDAMAIKENGSESSLARISQRTFATQTGGEKDYANRDDVGGSSTNRSQRKAVENFAASYDGLRNKRSVWNVNTKPYRGAHFATWPEDLVEPMILAGTGEKGCCATCGAAYKRVVEKEDADKPYEYKAVGIPGEGANRGQRTGSMGTGLPVKSVTWDPGCECPPATKRCIVLDPFSGSATTGKVALDQGRDYIGLDANTEYLDMAVARLQDRAAPQAPSEESESSVMDLFG